MRVQLVSSKRPYARNKTPLSAHPFTANPGIRSPGHGSAHLGRGKRLHLLAQGRVQLVSSKRPYATKKTPGSAHPGTANPVICSPGHGKPRYLLTRAGFGSPGPGQTPPPARTGADATSEQQTALCKKKTPVSAHPFSANPGICSPVHGKPRDLLTRAGFCPPLRGNPSPRWPLNARTQRKGPNPGGFGPSRIA